MARNFGVLGKALRTWSTDDLTKRYEILQKSLDYPLGYTPEEARKVLQMFKAELVRRAYSGQQNQTTGGSMKTVLTAANVRHAEDEVGLYVSISKGTKHTLAALVEEWKAQNIRWTVSDAIPDVPNPSGWWALLDRGMVTFVGSYDRDSVEKIADLLNAAEG